MRPSVPHSSLEKQSGATLASGSKTLGSKPNLSLPTISLPLPSIDVLLERPGVPEIEAAYVRRLAGRLRRGRCRRRHGLLVRGRVRRRLELLALRGDGTAAAVRGDAVAAVFDLAPILEAVEQQMEEAREHEKADRDDAERSYDVLPAALEALRHRVVDREVPEAP